MSELSNVGAMGAVHSEKSAGQRVSLVSGVEYFPSFCDLLLAPVARNERKAVREFLTDGCQRERIGMDECKGRE